MRILSHGKTCALNAAREHMRVSPGDALPIQEKEYYDLLMEADTNTVFACFQRLYVSQLTECGKEIKHILRKYTNSTHLYIMIRVSNEVDADYFSVGDVERIDGIISDFCCEEVRLGLASDTSLSASQIELFFLMFQVPQNSKKKRCDFWQWRYYGRYYGIIGFLTKEYATREDVFDDLCVESSVLFDSSVMATQAGMSLVYLYALDCFLTHTRRKAAPAIRYREINKGYDEGYLVAMSDKGWNKLLRPKSFRNAVAKIDARKRMNKEIEHSKSIYRYFDD